MSNPAQSCCSGKSSVFSTSLGILLIRLVLGAVFIYYGGQHLFGSQHLFGIFGGRGLHQFAIQIKSDGFPVLPPMVWAVLSSGTEFFGGILLLIGLFSRAAAVPVIFDMLAAMWVSRAAGFGTIDFNLSLIAMLAMVLLAGAGMMSLDAMMFRQGARGPQPLAAA